jgi:hypothetical protein
LIRRETVTDDMGETSVPITRTIESDGGGGRRVIAGGGGAVVGTMWATEDDECRGCWFQGHETISVKGTNREN